MKLSHIGLVSCVVQCSSEGNKACGGVSHEFGVVQHYRTSSNNCTAEGTRNTGQFCISSGWIYTSKPVRTNAQHKEPGLLGNFASIQGGSTLPNQPYMVNSHEFGVVQCLFEPQSNSKNKASHKFGWSFSAQAGISVHSLSSDMPATIIIPNI